MPPWTAENPDHLGLVQAVILDQCEKGLGYPNVLARADKQAVVTAQDRQAIRIDLVPRTPRFREDQFRDLFSPTSPARPGPRTQQPQPGALLCSEEPVLSAPGSGWARGALVLGGEG